MKMGDAGGGIQNRDREAFQRLEMAEVFGHHRLYAGVTRDPRQMGVVDPSPRGSFPRRFLQEAEILGRGESEDIEKPQDVLPQEAQRVVGRKAKLLG